MTYEQQVLAVVVAKLQRANRHAEKWGGRSEADFVFICSDFSDILAARGAPIGEIAQAFDRHFEAHSRQFPCVEDILGYWATTTAYRMDNGPDGHGALYAANHPYVAFQRKIGTNLGNYAVEVPVREHAGLATAAGSSTWAPVEEDEAPAVERKGSGLRRLSFAP